MHLRDVRTEFLLKLALAERLGIDQRKLVEKQRTVLEPIMAAIATRPPDDVVDLWRTESSASIARFLDAAIDLLDR